MPQPTFAISTHLYHDQPLGRDHLVEIAAHGFEAVELFANAPHFEPGGRQVEELEEALRDTGLRLHAVHAPVAGALRGGVWSGPLSLAAGDERARRHALDTTLAVLALADRLPFDYLVVHLGVPKAQSPSPEQNRAEAARRSVEALVAAAAPLGVQVALEIQANDLSSADALVRLIEEDLELPDLGVCFDFGHAFLMGDLLDAVETVSGHLVTTHVHDNHGARDEHLVPFAGRIEWESALMAAQKIGYEGTWVLELAGTISPRESLEQAQRARTRFERILRG